MSDKDVSDRKGFHAGVKHNSKCCDADGKRRKSISASPSLIMKRRHPNDRQIASGPSRTSNKAKTKIPAQKLVFHYLFVEEEKSKSQRHQEKRGNQRQWKQAETHRDMSKRRRKRNCGEKNNSDYVSATGTAHIEEMLTTSAEMLATTTTTTEFSLTSGFYIDGIGTRRKGITNLAFDPNFVGEFNCSFQDLSAMVKPRYLACA